ncbi:MAG: hypothetical protein K2I66_07050, partial [Bacteroidales bacterium]|nr:hypothetical protein [Bacteroidales bacterium]
MYDSTDKEDWHYIYRWNTGEKTDAIQVKFNGQRKVLYTGQRLSAIHWQGEYDTLWLNAGDNFNDDFLYYIAGSKEDTVILRAPDIEGTDVRYVWSNHVYINEERLLPDTEQYAMVYRDMWDTLGWEYGMPYFSCRVTAVSEEGVTKVLQSFILLDFLDFGDKSESLVQTPPGRQLHTYNVWAMPPWTQIYARLGDTLHFFSEMDYEVYPNHAEFAGFELLSYMWRVLPCRAADISHDSAINIYFKDNLYRNVIDQRNDYHDPARPTLGIFLEIWRPVYWGIKPDARIETDSVWVFFPQYPYSNLGERVDICLPPDAPLPSAEDTVYTFNLGPWNRELEYVEYAWFDGTKTASGSDSVVGTDSAFAYLFGRMDSVAPDLYVGRVVTRVASDSLWQDTCGCYVPCTDAACSGYDTVRI